MYCKRWDNCFFFYLHRSSLALVFSFCIDFHCSMLTLHAFARAFFLHYIPFTSTTIHSYYSLVVTQYFRFTHTEKHFVAFWCDEFYSFVIYQIVYAFSHMITYHQLRYSIPINLFYSMYVFVGRPNSWAYIHENSVFGFQFFRGLLELRVSLNRGFYINYVIFHFQRNERIVSRTFSSY